MKATLSYVPPKRKSPLEWFIDNNVSTARTSLDQGSKRFLDALVREDENNKI